MDPFIFREYDIRGVVGTQLTGETVSVIARAVGTYYTRRSVRNASLGFDARESSPEFADIFAKGLNECGIDVVMIGRVPTPVLYYTLHKWEVDGGVMITGSHNPSDHNGFKICVGTDALYGEQIAELREIAFGGNFAEGAGTVQHREAIDEYLSDLRNRFSLGATQLKAVVDAGNGMGGVTAVPLYRELGVEVEELFTEPDPAFPNHHPDPTVEKNLSDLVTSVRGSADLGIAFDGDADRIGVVDENGRVIWGDELLVIFERDVLRKLPGSTVIAEVKCSQNLYNDIARNGGRPVMSKAGHSIIKARMKATGAVLAGEMSGHMFFADRYYGFDDACYAGARLLEILSRSDVPLSALLSDLPETFSTPEIRVPCAEERKAEIVRWLSDRYSAKRDIITIDGIRIQFPHGWGLVRPSNTQAILVLRFEADSEEHLREIMDDVGSALLDANGAAEIRAAISTARSTRDEAGLAEALCKLSTIARGIEITREVAIGAYSEAAQLYGKLGRPRDEAWVLRHIGIIEEARGELAAAEQLYQRALDIYRDQGIEDLDHANAVRYAAAIKSKMGDPDAHELWNEALRLYRELGIDAGVAEAERRLAGL